MFTKVGGTTGTTDSANAANTAANLELLVDSFHSQFTDAISLTDQAKSLPGLHGSGKVRDLREAISLSPELGNLLKEYTEQSTRQGQHDKLDALIEAWANTSEMKSLQQQADAAPGVQLRYVIPHQPDMQPGNPNYETFVKRLGIVERFMGFTYKEGWEGGVSFTPLDTSQTNHYVALGDPQVDDINLAYTRFKTDIYESLLLQTRLKSYVDQLDLSLQANGTLKLDATRIQAAFNDAITHNPQEGFIDLIEFASAFGDKRLDRLGWNIDVFIAEEREKLSQLPDLKEELSSWTTRLAPAILLLKRSMRQEGRI